MEAISCALLLKLVRIIANHRPTLEKVGPTFSGFNATPAKTTKKPIMFTAAS